MSDDTFDPPVLVECRLSRAGSPPDRLRFDLDIDPPAEPFRRYGTTPSYYAYVDGRRLPPDAATAAPGGRHQVVAARKTNATAGHPDYLFPDGNWRSLPDRLVTPVDPTAVAIPDDGRYDADHFWLETRGWWHLDFASYFFETSGGFVERDEKLGRWYVGVLIEQVYETLGVMTDDSDGEPTVSCRCRTRAQVRAIEAVFGLRATGG